MRGFFQKHHDMTIIGQGGKIMLVTFPALLAAVLAHRLWPRIAALPGSFGLVRPVGYLLLALGLALWGTAVIQLLTGFARGRLVTTGAYALVRNPIYSSATFFILPAIALLTMTWVYLVASVSLYIAVTIFIGREETQLSAAFGREYSDYQARVDRMIPLRTPRGTELRGAPSSRNSLLVCGLWSSLLYVATDLMAASWYAGYSIADQNYSELLATGAPTRSPMILASLAYNLLVAAFAAGVWTSARPKRSARVTAAVIGGYAALSLVTPLVFQMDMRGAEATSRGSLHGPMTAVMSLFILLSMGFGASLLGRRFKLYSFATIVTVVVFGVLTGLQAPRLAAGLSTPWMGLTERVNIYATMTWFAALAIGLLIAGKGRGSTDGREVPA